jgi:hypothetical protein
METIKKYANHRVVMFLYLFILSTTFYKTYDRIFDKKVHLGGDNAGYYIYGKSIATGEGYVALHDKDKMKANHFPPGYPALIAATMKLFSGKITTIKAANGFFMLMALFVLFFLFRALTMNIHLSFVACLLALFNYHMLQYSTIMYSEIPYVLFSSLSLLLFMFTDYSKTFYRNWTFILFILVMVFAFYIRTMGVSLFISFTLILLLQKRWKYAAFLVGGFLLLVAPWQIRSHSLGGNSYVNQLLMKNPYRPELGPMTMKDWPERFTMNVKRYYSMEITNGVLPFEAIDYKQTVKQLKKEAGIVDPVDSTSVNKPVEPEKELTLEEKQKAAAAAGMPDAKVEITTKDYLITTLLLLLMAFGLWRMRDHRLLIGLYMAGTFGILFLWPEAWFGIRFMLPLVPIMIFLAMNGVLELPKLAAQVLKRKDPWVVSMVLPFVIYFPMHTKLEKRVVELENQAKGIYINKFKNYFDLATWSNKNLPSDAVVACRKGQLFYLYAHRYVTGFKNTLDREELIENLHDKGVTHVVLDQLGYASTSRYLYPAIKRYPGKFKVIHQLKNPDTYLMQFRYEMDYTGEWKDDKKHGKGTYRWDNGMVYEGDWIENMRTGQGKFTWPNKQVYEGGWLNDRRHGAGYMTMPDGSKIEGTWTNDILNGPVKLFDTSGKFIETGMFKNNTRIDKK